MTAKSNALIDKLANLSLIALLVLMVYVCARGLYHNLTSPGLEVDAGLFAEGARLQLSGGTLYVDLFDNKPPGIFVYLMPFVALFGPTTLAVNIATGVLNTVIGIVVGLLAYRFTDSVVAGLLGGLATCVVSVTSPKPETTVLMAIFGTSSLLLLDRGIERPSLAITAGIVFSLGIFTKQPLTAELPAVLLFIGLIYFRRDMSFALLRFVIGFAIGTVLVVTWLLANGALQGFWQQVVVAVRQFVFSLESDWRFSEESQWIFQHIFLGQTVPLFAPLVGFAVLAALACWRQKPRRPLVAITLIWVVCSFSAAAIGQSMKPAYFYQALPSLIVMISLGIPLFLRARPSFRIILIVAAFAGILFVNQRFIHSIVPERLPGWIPEDRRLVEFVRDHVDADECLWTWGYLNSFNYWAERQSCVSNPFDGHLMVTSLYPTLNNRIIYMQQLIQARPPLFIDMEAWGYFQALFEFADRYLSEIVYPHERYAIYAVDRSMWHEADANFGDEIRFIGYDLLPVDGPYCPGDTLTLAMTWQQINHPTHQYQMFVQLLTQDETARVAGYDGPPEDGDDRNATNTWVDSGEIRLGERFDMQIPADTAPGTYKLIVGLYDVVTTERLPVVDASGAPIGQYALLQELDVRGDC